MCQQIWNQSVYSDANLIKEKNMKSFIAASMAAAVLISGAVLWAKPGAIKDTVKEPSKAPAKAEKEGVPVSPLDFKLRTIDGKEMDLARLKGKPVLLVNVASKCGLTPQYKALEALYEKYKGQGLVVVGIPANNFGKQEPGTESEIKEFCTKNYGVTFPMASKISVLGEDQHPLYKFLTQKETAGDFAGDIEWNFAKFLIDRNGNIMARFASKTAPDSPQVVGAVEKALAAEATASAK
jgi:glutathione peroxidase